LQSNPVLNQQIEECAGVAVLVNARYEVIVGFLAYFRRAREVVPEYRCELCVVGKIVFEYVVWNAEMFREVFGEDKNKFTHSFKENLHQVPEAGDVCFAGPLIWTYQTM